MQKYERVDRLLAAKRKLGLSFDDIATTLGVTNVYAAQLFHGQLKPALEPKLRKLLEPAHLGDEDIAHMKKAPFHSYDPNILQEPALYRLYEALNHNGHSLKALINEKFGDGIMSAIDFYMSVDKMTGLQGEDRVVITMNGKFLPYIQQDTANDVAAREKSS